MSAKQNPVATLGGILGAIIIQLGDFLFALVDWAAEEITFLPDDVEATAVALVVSAIGALIGYLAGRFGQRYTEPVGTIDAIIHPELDRADDLGDSEGD
jgi:di/tricarboxylate transporter